MTKKPLVYIAGPITGGGAGKVLGNVHNACLVGQKIWDLGCAIVVPHWNAMHELIIGTQPYEFWMELDDHMLQRCDALFRMIGESGGADREEARAKEIGIPIFYDYVALLEWKNKVYGKKECCHFGD